MQSPDTCIQKTETVDVDLASHLLRAKKFLAREDRDALYRLFKERTGNKVTVTYKVAKRLRDAGVYDGRLYPVKGVGLACLPNKLRSSLAADFYHDIDMKQAHLAILINICKKHSIPSPTCEYVYQNRDDWIQLMDEDKDLVKLAITKVLFGGGETELDTIPTFKNHMAAFRNEIQDMVPKLVGLYPTQATSAKRKRSGNFNGSFINAICTSEERKILEVIDTVLTSQGYPCDTLIYDGCLCRKKQDETDIPPIVLRNTEIAILERTGFKIELTCKPLKKYYTLPEDDANKDYLDKKKEFERTHFKCTGTNSFFEIRPSGIIERTRSELMTSFEHLRFSDIDEKGKEVDKSFITEWLKDDAQLNYENVDYLPPPLECPSDTFNLYNGFAVQKMKRATTTEEIETAKAQVELIKNHIRFLVNNDEACYDYFIKLTAQLFQQPGKKPGVGLILRSNEHGVGKGMLFETISLMLGIDKAQSIVNPARDIFGQFNNCLENKHLVCLEEFGEGLGHKHIDQIKDLVTTAYDTINAKGKQVKKQRSFIRLWCFSNNFNILKIEASDRRWFAVECKGSRPSKAYFDALAACWNDHALSMFYDELMAMDITDYNWIDNRPVTEFYKELKEVNIEKEVYFISQRIQEHYFSHPNQEVRIRCEKLLEDFNLTTDYPLCSKKFGIKLKKMEIPSWTRVRPHGVPYYAFNTKTAYDWLVEKGFADL